MVPQAAIICMLLLLQPDLLFHLLQRDGIKGVVGITVIIGVNPPERDTATHGQNPDRSNVCINSLLVEYCSVAVLRMLSNTPPVLISCKRHW